MLKPIKFENLTRYINQIFPFLSTITFFSLIVESFTYRGFLFKNLYIDTTLLIIIAAGFGIVDTFYGHAKQKGTALLPTIFLYANSLLFPVLLLISVLMNIIEANHYPNYIFSTLHIQPENYNRIVIFSGILVLCNVIKSQGLRLRFISIHKPTLHLKINKNYYKIFSDLKLINITSLAIFFSEIFFISLLLFVSSDNSVNLFDYMIKNSAPILKNLSMSYPQKTEYKFYASYGNFYNYMEMIKVHTPPDSNILMPPQKNPWQLEGNQRLVRYFLFPRNLYYEENPEWRNVVDYVMIAWGNEGFPPANSDDYGWPKFSIEADSVYYFDLNSKRVKYITHEYIPSDGYNAGSYGLIKLN
ncbi:hypothetical protein A3A76_03700 [Candidatus Woesebacteria bacterium RIFCSPLOWO2_01_FULL_39_23]|uniref:Uncharacterized protein n=1 Tax=Candidatus Woesebacteria bacterium RIFCSPHIGHO2_01_FULL_40_22 TaxID=1802499 RepID=A0A1F7YLT3_9BACT|nr:MAG: hypothetical protein A2141_00325 [Candidatus Woesebacteria bacterium RBG_16_40_11]OGM27558.1 MAG: hypothetical protein A2628_02100 [Candidatus Woesebacteria bacterium RIFCSPHIGHO2_01_FULL_40_22]OGM36149.1 MAG: hypothetical protein A3E41_02345 [Candidatus Woesebacteria bacterium RIFCSPHIGHO2_12_FULL_38_9]OGM62732.1 MAG: hypothetical protein A3A76_03700 [Candidatus Woesebacteria bacterium RIFCSPLOWO2_01_FULL_39_23]